MNYTLAIIFAVTYNLLLLAGTSYLIVTYHWSPWWFLLTAFLLADASFLNKKEKYTFYKLSRNYSYDELKLYFISNLMENPKLWWGELNSNECEETYKKYPDLHILTTSLNYDIQDEIVTEIPIISLILTAFRLKSGVVNGAPLNSTTLG